MHVKVPTIWGLGCFYDNKNYTFIDPTSYFMIGWPLNQLNHPFPLPIVRDIVKFSTFFDENFYLKMYIKKLTNYQKFRISFQILINTIVVLVHWFIGFFNKRHLQLFWVTINQKKGGNFQRKQWFCVSLSEPCN